MKAAPSRNAGSLLRMRDLAARTGLSRQTLNHYLLLGLITETERTPKGRCLFLPEVVDRLAEIEALKGRRTLREIRETLLRRDAPEREDA